MDESSRGSNRDLPPSFEEATQESSQGRGQRPAQERGGENIFRTPIHYPRRPGQGYPQQQYVQQYPQQQYPQQQYPQQQYPQQPYGYYGNRPPGQPMRGGPVPVIISQVPRDVGRGGQIYNRNMRSDSFEDSSFDGSFAELDVRAGFIRKVYFILTLQMLITIGMILLFMFVPAIKFYVLGSRTLYILAYVGFFATYIALTCCGNLRRQWPCNIFLLLALTIAMSYLLGVITICHKTDIVLIAMGVTAGVCLLISMFAIQTKWDITGCGAYLCVALIVVMVFGIVTMIITMVTGPSRILQLIFGGLIALVFSMYLMYDTQMIIGGRKIQLSPEEYIYGSLHLYIDIIYIFMAILMISRNA